MKYYFYLTIAIGIMFIMAIAGVPTTSNKLVSIFASNSSGNITLNTPDTTTSTSDTASFFARNDSGFFNNILIGLVAIAVIGLISGIFQGLNPLANIKGTDAVKAVLGYLIFGYVVQDIWGIANYIFNQDSTGVFGWITLTLISLFIVGFAIATIEWIGGSD